MLRLENALLRFEQRLSPPQHKNDANDSKP
jgi:hypothetical protein